MLVLSLGAGVAKLEEKYNAKDAAKWGLLRWVFNKGASPLLDVYGDAGSDMVDIHVSTIFQSLRNEQNYLRIQVWKRTRIITVFNLLVFEFLHLG